MSVKRFIGLGNIGRSLELNARRAVLGRVDNQTASQHSDRVIDSALPARVAASSSVRVSDHKIGSVSRDNKQVRQQQENIPAVLNPRQLTSISAAAPFETLFDNFSFEAIPFYNFWVEDESSSDGEQRGDRSLEEIPRFIKLVWSPAPDLPTLTGFVSRDKTVRHTKPVKFAREMEEGRSAFFKGIRFSPKHLQPSGFSIVTKALANGFIGPGVLHSVVELQLEALKSIRPNFLISRHHEVDEDSFLTHPSTKGISLSELRTNIHQVTNGVLGAAKLSTAGSSLADRSNFFEGRFSVENSLSDSERGTLTVSDVSSSPAISFTAKTAISRQPSHTDLAVSVARQVSSPSAFIETARSVMTKVNFVRSSISGLVSSDRVSSISRPEHAENVASLARFLPNLEVFSQSGIQDSSQDQEIPSFASPPGLPPLEYVGYIIEKYRKGVGGAFELVDRIEIPNRLVTEYYDCKVRYGALYRYRIRSVVRWTRPANVGVQGLLKHLFGLFGSQTKSVLSEKSSYFGSEWNRGWAYSLVLDTVPPPPPDELSIRPNSEKSRIEVTLRFPDDSQRDILSMRLLRKIQTPEGRDLTGWGQVGPDFGPSNVLYYDEDVQRSSDGESDNSLSYVYAAITFSRHGEISFLSEQLAARLNPDYRLKGEFPVRFVSCSGVRLEHVGSFSVNPVRRVREEVIAQVPRFSEEGVEPMTSFVLESRESRGNSFLDDARYVIRIESLDTGEKKDHEVNVLFSGQKELVISQEAGIFVSQKRALSLLRERIKENVSNLPKKLVKIKGKPTIPIVSGRSGRKPF